MTTIRVIPSSTTTTNTTTNSAPPIRPPEKRLPHSFESTAPETYPGVPGNGNLIGPRSVIQSTAQEKKARGSGDSQAGRFTFTAFEKARKFVTELPLRDRPAQLALPPRGSLNRVDESTSSGSAPPSPSPIRDANNPQDSSSSTTSPASRQSFSTAATSPRETPDDLRHRSQNSDHSSTTTSADRESDDTGSEASTAATTPPPSTDSNGSAAAAAAAATMHQTSSRLLRMTDDERPYTKDFMDLFSTLMVSLPLTAHRVRFQKIEHSFTSEEAINNLGSLKFSQSNRMPDPKDPSRIVTTTTTTTFSMAKEMARAVCQRFLEARFIESADGKPQTTFALKGPVWLLTPKGIAVLQRFCQRNGIQQRHVLDLIESNRNTLSLVILERDAHNDRLSHDQSTIEVIFRRFAGLQGPNVRSASDLSDPELSDHYNGLVGIKQAARRALGNKIVLNTFTGKGVVDWLMDCTSIIDRRETVEIADLFIRHGLMEMVVEDHLYARDNPVPRVFQPTRASLYSFTARGRKLAGHDKKEDADDAHKTNGNGHSGQRETNNNRLERIVGEPSWRLLFREYLCTTHCEENLSFYLEVKEFTDSYDQADRAKAFVNKTDAIRENLAAAYSLYNAYLAPGSPNELNIDHNLRNGLASRMTRAVGDDDSMLVSLQEVVDLFKEAQRSVFKLMASDSVPKFLKDPKFAKQLREQNFDQSLRDPSPASSS